MSDKKFNVGDEVLCESVDGVSVVKAVDGDSVWIKGEFGSMFTFKADALELNRGVPDEVEALLVEYATNHTFKSKIEHDKFRECAQIFLSLLRIEGL